MITLVAILYLSLILFIWYSFSPSVASLDQSFMDLGPEHTNWSILFFASLYLVIVVICLDRWYHTEFKTRKKYFMALAVLFFAAFVNETSCINLDYRTYMEIINNEITLYIALTYTVIVSLLLTINYIWSCLDRLKKK